MGVTQSKLIDKLRVAFRPNARALWAFSALVLAGLFAGRNLASWPVRLRYPGEESFEGMPLAEVVNLRQGLPIYAPASPERFSAAIYGPFFYLLGARLVNPQRPAYLSLRVVSVLAILGGAVGCAILAFWVGRSYLAAALAPLFFLSYGFVTYNCVSARPDSAALLLSFWGFLVGYRFRNSRALLSAVPLMLAGFFYKQQFVAGPLAVLLFLLLERRYRGAAEFAGLMVLGGLSLLAMFQYLVFPGEAFFRHFVLYNSSLFTWSRLPRGLFMFGLVLLLPLLVSLEFLRAHPDKLVSCYLGCAVFLGLLTFCKEGSDLYYFFESALIVSALFPALLADRVREPSRAVELFVLLALSLFAGQLFTQPAPEQRDFVRDRAVQEFLRRSSYPHVPALSYYTGDLVRAGLETPFPDIYQFTRLVRRGMLSDEDLVAQLRSRRFGIVVLNFKLQAGEESYWGSQYLTEPMRRGILANYRLAANLEMPGPEKLGAEDRFYVWVPRSLRPSTGQ